MKSFSAPPSRIEINNLSATKTPLSLSPPPPPLEIDSWPPITEKRKMLTDVGLVLAPRAQRP